MALVTSKLLLRRPYFPGVRRESSTCACCHCCRHQRHQKPCIVTESSNVLGNHRSVRGAAAAELTLWAYAVGGGAARDVNRATMKELLIIKEVVGEFLFDSLLRPLDELNLVPLLK